MDKSASQIGELLPELQEIDDEDLKDSVRGCWKDSFDDSEFNSMSQLEFGPGYEQIGRQSQIKHVREVTQCAVALTETLENTRGFDVNRDYIIAGALLHDISKFYEKSPNFDGYTMLGDLIPHPHFAIAVLEQHGIPREIQHIVLIHTSGSKPQAKTMEAMIVMLADIASANAIWWHNANELLLEVHTKNIQS